MPNYYYTENPDVDHAEQSWDFTLLDQTLTFITDNGVFSKNTVDYGSRVLLTAVAPTLTTAAKILDVGCGYGPIGLALAKSFPASQVDMVDVNNRALALCQRNATINKIKNVKIWPSNCYQDVEDVDYDAIISNPPVRAGKQVVHTILAEAYAHLLPGGTLTIVLQKKQGAPSAKKKMLEVFGNCTTLTRDKGYFILQSIK